MGRARSVLSFARTTRRDRFVAIKVLRFDLTPEQAAALVHELGQLVGKGLSHPSIAAPIAAGLENGTVYLAEEYAVGDSLDVVLRESGPLQREAAVDLIETCAEAIDYAADRGVHHGSLHPRDLIVSTDGARITGFGIAGALSSLGPPFDTYSPHADRAPYAAPENPSDVYSLAAIAFEAISGRRLSAANLDESGGEHGPELRRAFSSALALGSGLRPVRAGEFASSFAAAAASADAPAERDTHLAGKPLGLIAPDASAFAPETSQSASAHRSEPPDLDLS